MTTENLEPSQSAQWVPLQTLRDDSEGGEPAREDAYNFRFVEVGEPSQGRDEESRSAIRAHVMRDFYDKRKQRKRPSVLPEVASAASKKEGASQSTHRFKVGPQGLEELKRRKKKRKDPVAPRDVEKASVRRESRGEQSTACNVQKLGCHVSQEAAQFLVATGLHQSGLFENLTADEITELRQRSIGDTGFVGDETHLSEDTDSCSPSQMNNTRPENLLLIPTSLSTGIIDPFNSLPLSRSPRIQALLYHANQGILSSRLMGQIRTEWLSLAIQDTALFHVALSHYAGNFGLSHQAKDTVEALRFRMEAMNMINARLESPETAITDGNIGAVASLGSYEATNGDLIAIRTHMTGLKKMMKMRGGIEAAGLNQYTKRLVLWSDLNCAVALASDPFPLDECDNATVQTFPINRSESNSKDDAPLLERSKQSTKNSQALGRGLVDSLTELRRFISTNSGEHQPMTASRMEKIRKSDDLFRTERRLLILANRSGPRKFLTGCCLAAIIFLDNHLRGVGFNARIMDRIVSRLQISMNLVLGAVSIPSLSHNTRRAMVWVLSVGAMANIAGKWQERNCFYEALVKFCDVMGLQSWEEVGQILKSFLWPSSWDSYGHTIWDRIEEIRWTTYMAFPCTGEWQESQDSVDNLLND